MKDTDKYQYIPEGIQGGNPQLIIEGLFPVANRKDGVLSSEQIQILKRQYIDHLGQVAPDLKSHNLAEIYAEGLFNKLEAGNPSSLEELVHMGSIEFNKVGRYVLGPLAVGFVDTVLRESEGITIFPARDATPFFYAAKTLKALNPQGYAVESENILNPVFNRKLWGVEDEQDRENEVLPISHPLVQKLLSQLGFGKNIQKSFIEVGCWGSMVDQLKRQMVKEDYSVYFLFTHLPGYIYGFTNIHGVNLPEAVLETIADTWEAFPKFFKRPTKLIEENGVVRASLEGKVIDSPFLSSWTTAALQGIVDAAKDFAMSGHRIDPYAEIVRLWQLSLKAQHGEFTGVLPRHTETWTEGEDWIANWQWGKIPPLK